jgi:hypothetical protein
MLEDEMGWFLRKSFRFGPLRLNLSRRGIGASVGVKGLRAGVDARGQSYVAGGRAGIYFRQRIPTGDPRPISQERLQRSSFILVRWIVVAVVLAGIALLLLLAR